MTDYSELNMKLRGLVGGVPHLCANLANASALLFETLEDINWAGFYILEGETLVLGPFQGRPACIEIAAGRGVCGAAVQRRSAVRVENVHDFPGHIACDSASMSEIVLPIFAGERIFGVLDIDSPLAGRFSEDDQRGLEEFVRALEEELDLQ